MYLSKKEIKQNYVLINVSFEEGNKAGLCTKLLYLSKKEIKQKYVLINVSFEEGNKAELCTN